MAKEKIKRKGYMKGTTGHEGIRSFAKKDRAEKRAGSFAHKKSLHDYYGGPGGTPAGKQEAKFSRGFKKAAKKQAAKRIAKGVAKSALTKVIGPIGAVLTAAEIAKGAVKVGKSMKAKSACQERGGVYKKGFCITSKSIKARKKK